MIDKPSRNDDLANDSILSKENDLYSMLQDGFTEFLCNDDPRF